MYLVHEQKKTKTRVFQTVAFSRFAKDAGISNAALFDAIKNAENGLVDAKLGGGVIKQRVARESSGKSRGYRTIIIINVGTYAFYVHGFAKNKTANITVEELSGFRKLAKLLLAYKEIDIKKAIEAKMLIEVFDD